MSLKQFHGNFDVSDVCGISDVSDISCFCVNVLLWVFYFVKNNGRSSVVAISCLFVTCFTCYLLSERLWGPHTFLGKFKQKKICINQLARNLCNKNLWVFFPFYFHILQQRLERFYSIMQKPISRFSQQII